MKHLLLTLPLLFASATTVRAQLVSGFYRAQNAETERYIYVTDDKAYFNAVGGDIDLGALLTVKGFDNVVSNPASVAYIEATTEGYVLRSQGCDTYAMTGRYLKLRELSDGTYWVYATESGITKYLCDIPLSVSNSDIESVVVNDNFISRQAWNILPVAPTEACYFGLQPDLTVGGKHYTTLYMMFPFTFASSGMKAYYVSMQGNGMAVLEPVEGTVPGETALVIECGGNTPADNKLNLLTSGGTPQAANQLQGVYFCHTRSLAHYNYMEYDPETMRLLGTLSDGSLGFVKADVASLPQVKRNGVVYYLLPANKAYLKVAAGSPDEIRIVSKDVFESGISAVAAKGTTVQGTYTLAGQRVPEGTSLRPGIYLRDGKKIVVK